MILKVARLGNPVLRAGAKPVSAKELRARETQSLIDDMIESMREYAGVGLAANQVHVAKCIVVIEVPVADPRDPDALEMSLAVLVNPEIVERGKEAAEDWEGCLSVPDLRGRVSRPLAIRVRALDRKGKAREFAAEGFLARVIQHEIDHLHGKVFLDRMTSLESLTFLAEHERYGVKDEEPGEDEASDVLDAEAA